MEKPNYFTVIPSSVRYDERLKATEKIIYAEITALVNFKGYCYATNSYFAKLYGVHKNSICIWINNLVKYGYLRVEYVIKEIDGEKKQERRIYITDVTGVGKAKEEAEEKIKIWDMKAEEDGCKEENKEEEIEEKEEIGNTDFSEGVSQKTLRDTENVDTPTQKTERGYQSKLGDPLNENIEENNTSRLLKENNYYIYTYRGEENFPIIRDIMKKYNELGLP